LSAGTFSCTPLVTESSPMEATSYGLT